MKKIDQLMSKPMSREQFLQTLGLGFIALFGLPAILGLLTHDEPTKKNNSYGYGYGRNSYGH
ncbi:MAG TPA: hypothetical protein VFK97_02635 [Candidatus Saccharimonadales bacterium]|nr:hypothetical protein [Candidatus Saccharimonadales bacterium]